MKNNKEPLNFDNILKGDLISFKDVNGNIKVGIFNMLNGNKVKISLLHENNSGFCEQTLLKESIIDRLPEIPIESLDEDVYVVTDTGRYILARQGKVCLDSDGYFYLRGGKFDYYYSQIIKVFLTRDYFKVLKYLLDTYKKMTIEHALSLNYDLEEVHDCIDLFLLNFGFNHSSFKGIGFMKQLLPTNFDKIVRQYGIKQKTCNTTNELYELSNSILDKFLDETPQNKLDNSSQLSEETKQVHITRENLSYEIDPIINFFKTPNIIKEYELKVGDKVKSKRPLTFYFQDEPVTMPVNTVYEIKSTLESVDKETTHVKIYSLSYNGFSLCYQFSKTDLELVEIFHDSIQAKSDYLNQEYEDFEGVLLQDQNKPTDKEIFVI